MGSTGTLSPNSDSTASLLNGGARPISSGFLARQERWRPDRGMTAAWRLDDAGGHRVRLKFSAVSIPLKSFSSLHTGPCDSVTASNLRSDDDPPRPDQPACWLVPAAP